MKVINSTKLIAVDIDETLVLWNNESYIPHLEHIKLVKRFHKRGHTLIAWSAGGAQWAARVIKELKLEKYFEVVMDKPAWFIDDQPASAFLPETSRVYISS